MRWLLVVAAAACNSSQVQDDAPIFADAFIIMSDTADASSCGVVPTQQPSGVTGCNLLTQTGCAAGENCAWIWNGASMGYIGCIPGTGNRVVSQCCAVGTIGVVGYDNCVKGAVCDSQHICALMCDPHGGVPKCPMGTNCTTQPGFLGSGAMAEAGICVP